MPSHDKPEGWLSIGTRLITSTGGVALLGALLLGLVTLMGMNDFLKTFRRWV